MKIIRALPLVIVALAGILAVRSEAQGPVVLRNSSGTEIATSANPVRTDPTGSTAQPVTGTFWQATQPVSGTFWQATQPVSAAALPLPTGAATEATLGTIDTDLKANIVLKAGTNLIGKVGIDQTTPGTTNGVVLGTETTKVIGTVRNIGNAGAVFDGATGAAPPANVIYVGGIVSGATGGLLGGITACDQKVNVSLTANTQLISGVSGRNVFICHYEFVAGAATNVALVEGTGSTCGTGTAGMAGGSTAATGWNFAANSGISSGSGLGWITKTSTAADNVCLLVSAANQVSGVITYAIY